MLACFAFLSQFNNAEKPRSVCRKKKPCHAIRERVVVKMTFKKHILFAAF